MNGDALQRWKVIGVVATAVIVLTLPIYALKENRHRGRSHPDGEAAATFVGREQCISCHERASESWRGSHHDKAMAAASDSSVLGDFDDADFAYGDITARFYRRDGKYYVRTQGVDGEPGDFEIAYTFGVEPLQQYLIPFPGGRLQSQIIPPRKTDVVRLSQ